MFRKVEFLFVLVLDVVLVEILMEKGVLKVDVCNEVCVVESSCRFLEEVFFIILFVFG